MKIFNFFLFISLFFINLRSTNYLYKVFTDKTLKYQFSLFLDNVLKQTESTQFNNFIDDLLKNKTYHSDTDFYADILKNIHKIKPRLNFYYQLKALQNQKQILSEQAKKLLGNIKTINGCVEIGTPAAYISELKKSINVNDKIYYLNENKKISDIAQAYSYSLSKGFKAYDHFVNLNNYDKIKESDIPSKSVDLVICFIGLHHVPKDKLTEFILSIHRILRPGGIFILREHQTIDEETYSLTFAAHSIYNALIANETLESETNEYRNFNPLNYWINIIQNNGFECDWENLHQQHGDPTLNTMIKFTKIAQNTDEVVEKNSTQLKQKTNDYHRDLEQSYLTSCEWLNVDVSQEYSDFINHTPFYEFPYIESVKSYWNVFLKSWKVASEKKSHMEILKSPYTLMNLFIGITMSLEYGAKSLISWPIRLLFSGEESGLMTAIIYDPKNEIDLIDNQIKVISQDKDIKIIQIPRYKEFLKVIIKIANSSIKVKEIANQKFIQFKIKHDKNLKINFDSINGCKKLYQWSLPTKLNFIYLAIRVEVEKINEVIKELNNLNVELLYIHDF